jgi:hypothetical protein
MASIISAAVSVQAFDLTTFCTTDPPADPQIGPADYLALLNPAALSDYVAARQKFGDWWKHIYWHQACQCTLVPTPPLGPVSQPGPGGQNTGLPQGPSSGPCWDTTLGFTAAALPPGPLTVIDANALLPGNQTVAVTPNFTGGLAVAPLVPAGVQSITFTATGEGTDPGPFVQLMTYGTTGTPNNAQALFFLDFANQPSGTTLTVTHPLPANSVSWNAQIAPFLNGNQVQGSSWSLAVELSYTCTANPPNEPVVPCCPPDPGLELRINQILEIVSTLTSSSGSSPPTSWHDGTRHQALTGSGRLQLATAAVGARVEISTIPPGIDVHPGDPQFYFDLGFITPIAVNVPLRGQRLVFNPQSFALPQFADGLAWTLPVGAVINLVELLPVP